MRKFKFFAAILTLMMFLSSFAACDFLMSSEQPASSSMHTCESVCEECGKCTNEECTDDACEDKCECEAVEPEPEHECESVCPTCNKCLDTACEEEACEEKCQGHTPAPTHTCESVCPTCNKCLDTACEEEACAEKCQGHAPAHVCESVCPTCNKCLDTACEEEACAEKCEGHAPAHVCESVCPTCNKCLDTACEEEACAEKCEGHVPPHVCESVCPTCNKCLDTACEEEACAEKCEGHVPPHVCESVCPTCNKCLDTACEAEACVDKCQGHVVIQHTCESVCELCKGCKDIDCTEEVCEDKCPGHTVNDDWDELDLKFMSFNIVFSSSSGSDAAEVTSWTQRKEHVLNFVNNSGAHVIGLQEIAEWKSDAQNQRVYFEKNLASKYEIVYFGGHVNLATIYDKTVFTLLFTEQYWYSDTPDEVSYGWDGTNYRAATILMLEHKATGQIVRAINTHGPLSDAGNVKAFELLANRTLSTNLDAFTFLCGDFNAGTGKLGYVPIAEKLQDCRLTAEESPNRGHNSYNGFGKYEDNPNSNNPIDHCFVSNHDNVKVLNYQVCVDRWGENNYLSDHYAIATTVRIYNNSEKAWSGFY